MLSPQLKNLENQIVAWAMQRPAVRAAVICGSTERRTNPGDEWADLDVEIYATDFTEFLASSSWLKGFGTLWTYLYLPEDDLPVFLALYEGGEKVDFHFFPLAELQNLADARELPDSCRRGYRIVVDKDGLAAQLPPAQDVPLPYPRPSESEFAFQVQVFWYGVLYVAKQIRRRNLWVVKFRDWTVKHSLLRMLEWHAQATHQWQYDTWYGGHFISQWVDPQTWQELQGVFGEFDAGSSWRALLATAALFQRLALETAQQLGYTYPLDLADQVAGQVRTLHQSDDRSA